MASIKVLSISLVLLCVVVTAFVSSFLAVTSSDAALDDIKQSRDASVNTAFTVGSDSVRNRTTEYMDLLLFSTTDYLTQFLKHEWVATVTLAQDLSSHPWDDVKRWEWHSQSLARMYWSMYYLTPEGCTGLGVFLNNRLLIAMYESQETHLRPPEEYHSLEAGFNFGDDHPDGGINMSFLASLEPGTGAPAYVTNASTDLNRDPPTCRKSAVPTNGTLLNEPCYQPLWFDPLVNPLYGLTSLIPLGVSRWSTPVAINNEYISVSCFMPIQHGGARSGFVTAGADLRKVSKFLSNMDIGGPVGGHPSRGRVFVTVRDTWIPDPTAKGRLIGSSHGNAAGFDSNGLLVALPLENSTDSIIHDVAQLTKEADIEGLAVSGELTTFNLTTAYAPEGEEFYYRYEGNVKNTNRVGKMADKHGIDWYVHIVIDRAYILGSIDTKVAETQKEIRAAEDKVDDDLAVSRTILYVVITVAGMALIVVAVVFMLKIIDPLLVLEKEMAMVAVMRLEGVNMQRPLSSLQEVRLMQVSFLQMIQNLVEYRNYMPASVLQTSDENGDDIYPAGGASTMSEAVDTDKQSSGSGSSNSRHIIGKHGALHGAEAKQKKVTLLACNVVSFLHNTQHAADTLSQVYKYLTMSLQHVKSSRGIPDSFSGDRLYVSFNGARPCSSHRIAAYTCGRGIAGDTTLGKRFSIGIVSGEVKCGHMGCEGMKKYSFIGSLASWVHIVERVGRMGGADIAIDKVMHEEVTNVAYVRSLQHVWFPKHCERTLMVYEVMKQKEHENMEWMYQLAEGARGDPNTKYNNSYSLMMAGDVEGAIKELEGYADDSSVVKLYRDRLQKAVSDMSLIEPYGKRSAVLN